MGKTYKQAALIKTFLNRPEKCVLVLQRGFTVLELLVSITIIGTLVAFSFVGYTSYKENTWMAKGQASAAQIYAKVRAIESSQSNLQLKINAGDLEHTKHPLMAYYKVLYGEFCLPEMAEGFFMPVMSSHTPEFLSTVAVSNSVFHKFFKNDLNFQWCDRSYPGQICSVRNPINTLASWRI